MENEILNLGNIIYYPSGILAKLLQWKKTVYENSWEVLLQLLSFNMQNRT